MPVYRIEMSRRRWESDSAEVEADTPEDAVALVRQGLEDGGYEFDDLSDVIDGAEDVMVEVFDDDAAERLLVEAAPLHGGGGSLERALAALRAAVAEDDALGTDKVPDCFDYGRAAHAVRVALAALEGTEAPPAPDAVPGG